MSSLAIRIKSGESPTTIGHHLLVFGLLALFGLMALIQFLPAPYVSAATQSVTLFSNFPNGTPTSLPIWWVQTGVGTFAPVQPSPSGTTVTNALTGGIIYATANSAQGTASVQYQSTSFSSYGMQLAYPFDEGSGSTVYDITNNQFTGTTNGSPTWCTVAQTPVAQGSCLIFAAASSQSVSVGTQSQLQFGKTGTIITWLYWTSNSNRQYVAGDASVSASNGGYALYINATGFLKVLLANSTASQTLSAPTALAQNTWYHVMTTWDGSHVFLYTGSVQSANATQTVIPAQGVNAFAIGAAPSGTSYYYNGRLDMMAFYNRPMSDEENIEGLISQPNQPHEFIVAASTITLSISYYKEDSFLSAGQYSIVGGGNPSQPSISVLYQGNTETIPAAPKPILATGDYAWGDDGTPWSVSNPLNPSGSNERWQALTGTTGIMAVGTYIKPTYYNQYYETLQYNLLGDGSLVPQAPIATYTQFGSRVTQSAGLNPSISSTAWVDAGSILFYPSEINQGSATWQTSQIEYVVSSSATYNIPYTFLSANSVCPTNSIQFWMILLVYAVMLVLDVIGLRVKGWLYPLLATFIGFIFAGILAGLNQNVVMKQIFDNTIGQWQCNTVTAYPMFVLMTLALTILSCLFIYKLNKSF